MRWFGRHKDSRSPSTLPAPESPVFEALEDRLALYQGPMISGMPPLASLENQFDTVVRIDTNAGRIDVELFDQLAPTAVAAFKTYVNSGKFDDSFFSAMTPGLLYGGRATFSDATGLSTIVPNAPTPNGLTRSNLQGTLTMVPINSTQVRNNFAINLANNTSLNTTSGGYTVFGKVVQGWDIVQMIAGLHTVDLNNSPKFNTPGGPYNRVPVTAAYNAGVGPTEATLVKISDIEVVKAAGATVFFVQTLVYPEGFRSNTTVESIAMVNLDDSHTNFYQIIARYETGQRDSVILTGTMAAGARLTLKINDFNSPTYNIVRSGVGYAIEIRTTLPFSASLNHRDSAGTHPGDLGVLLAQSFQSLAYLFPGQLQSWNLAGGEKGTGDRSYVLFQNLTDQITTVNVLLTSTNGFSQMIQVGLKPSRRGGIDVGSLAGFPDGAYSVKVTSNRPIVAALSEYKTGAAIEGNTALGTINGASTEGYLGAARVPSSGTSQFDVYYSDPNVGAVTVNFQFVLNDGTVLNGNPVLLTSAQRRKTVTLSSLNPSLPTDTNFSVMYTVNNGVTPVTVSYRADFANDMMTTPFQTLGALGVVFADGYTDPTLNSNQFSETISVFNPYSPTGSVLAFQYDLVFHFSDGTVIWASDTTGHGPALGFALGNHQRADVHASDFSRVLTKINSNPTFRFYSVEVVASPFAGQTIVGGVVAQITRLHNTWGMAMTSIPALDQSRPVVFLNNAEFH